MKDAMNFIYIYDAKYMNITLALVGTPCSQKIVWYASASSHATARCITHH